MDSIKNRIADEEWTAILAELGLNKKCNLPNVGGFADNYFAGMEGLIASIRSNPYLETLSIEDKARMMEDFSVLGSLFHCYGIHMRRYNEAHPESAVDYKRYQIRSSCPPTAHNYYSCLRDSLFKPMLVRNYYMRYLDSIEEFVESRGVYPEYLYNVRWNSERFVIDKLELLSCEKVGTTGLLLPNYYVVNQKPASLEKHLELYAKYNINPKNFVESEWPVLCWVAENRPCEFEQNDQFTREDNDNSELVEELEKN